jgi:hypothetical protein
MSYLLNSSMVSMDIEYKYKYMSRGNLFLIASSILYIIASLRDSGIFWFMPYWGKFLSMNELLQEENSISDNADSSTSSSNQTFSTQSTIVNAYDSHCNKLNISSELLHESDSLLG